MNDYSKYPKNRNQKAYWGVKAKLIRQYYSKNW